MNRARLFLILRILVSLGLLTLLLWLARENLAKIGYLLSSVNLSLFILALLLYIGSIIFMAWRLRIALAVQGTTFSISGLFYLTLVGCFFSNFMPTSVGGDLVKGYYIAKKINSKMTSYISILVDRIIGMLSLALIAFMAMLAIRREVEYKFIFLLVSLLLLFCIFAVLLLSNKIMQKKISANSSLTRLFQIFKLDSQLKRMFEAMNVYSNQKKQAVKMFTLSVVMQVIVFFAVYLLSIGLCVYIPFGKILLFMPIISCVSMIPITMNGLGLREWAFVLFFSPSIGNVAALSLSLLYLAMFLLTSLIGGLVYLFWR